MVVGIPTWGDRVSPVLDAAERLLVFDTGDPERRAGAVGLAGLGLWSRAAEISRAGIDVLICGAVTRPLMDALAASGIRVVPWVSGEVNEILDAFGSGELAEGRFSMPGCGRQRCRRRRRSGSDRRGR